MGVPQASHGKKKGLPQEPILSPPFTSPRFTSPVQSSPVHDIKYAKCKKNETALSLCTAGVN